MDARIQNETPNDSGSEALADALNATFRALRFVMVLLLAVYACSGIFIVKQHEKAFVLRFGRIAGIGEDRVKGPGLHWTLPRPFSEIVRVQTERVQALATRTFWYAADQAFQEEAASQTGETLQPDRDGYNLTGDANLLHSTWSVRYTIDNPEAALFGFKDINDVLHGELDRAVMSVTARFPIDGALRTDLESLRETVETTFRRRAADLKLGIRVQGIDLLAILPPRQVAQAFDDVVQAEQKRGKQISDARAYASRAMNEAKGETARIRSEGEAQSQRLLSEIQSDADYFEQVYVKYKQNPDTVRSTLLQDTVRRTLAGVDQKYIIDRSGGLPPQIRLQLGRERESKR
ncbi:MAG: protease modulator HflK [bacterium]